jgi:hypothetical protein
LLARSPPRGRIQEIRESNKQKAFERFIVSSWHSSINIQNNIFELNFDALYGFARLPNFNLQKLHEG